MAWYDPVTEFAPNVLVGVGIVLAAPIVFPVVRGVFRPVAKSVIKGYLTVQDTVTEWTAETGEQVSDLVAEARAEHARPADTEFIKYRRGPEEVSIRYQQYSQDSRMTTRAASRSWSKRMIGSKCEFKIRLEGLWPLGRFVCDGACDRK